MFGVCVWLLYFLSIIEVRRGWWKSLSLLFCYSINQWVNHSFSLIHLILHIHPLYHYTNIPEYQHHHFPIQITPSPSPPSPPSSLLPSPLYPLNNGCDSKPTPSYDGNEREIVAVDFGYDKHEKLLHLRFSNGHGKVYKSERCLHAYNATKLTYLPPPLNPD